jgi:hypothetical protein
MGPAHLDSYALAVPLKEAGQKILPSLLIALWPQRLCTDPYPIELFS